MTLANDAHDRLATRAMGNDSLKPDWLQNVRSSELRRDHQAALAALSAARVRQRRAELRRRSWSDQAADERDAVAVECEAADAVVADAMASMAGVIECAVAVAEVAGEAGAGHRVLDDARSNIMWLRRESLKLRGPVAA